MKALDRPLPTGIVTFLLTDIEGSTRLWEASPNEAAAAVARHYEILESAIGAHGGVRPVEQGEGDSVVAAFARPSDAVAAALDAQRSLTTEVWPFDGGLRVRIAVHTGEAKLRDEGNYFGPAIIRCARLRACGHGGQVLVSQATVELVREHLPRDATLVDLGAHRLKDLNQPERIWQLNGEGLPTSFPPVRSLDAFRHNLPATLAPIIGRVLETAQVVEVLDQNRLVTLTGSGGVGKSRLGLQVGAELVDRFDAGVSWCELAALRDPSEIGAALLRSIDGRQEPGIDTIAQLISALSESTILLIIDNCEHLVGECAEIVDRILRDTRGVTVLATSREPLGVHGELIWRVPSLTAPTEANLTTDLAELGEFDAVRLFVERARRARTNFTLNDDNAAAISQICRRLDGIPLAIELAASRCRSVSPERIATMLDDRFRLLTGGARTAIPRQQTLAASVEWSYQLLEPDEAKVFRRLGTFAGQFSLDAAEHVVSAPGDIDPLDVLELISRVVDRSLVDLDETHGAEPQYRLLETIRQYAVDQCALANELPVLRDAHADWYTAWAEGFDIDAQLHPGLEQFHTAYSNLRTAMSWSETNTVRMLRLLSAVGRYWSHAGRYDEALAHGERALTNDGTEHQALWARACAATSHARIISGDLSPIERCYRAAEICRHSGDAATEARALLWMAINVSEDTAVFDRAMVCANNARLPVIEAVAASFSAYRHAWQGQLADAVDRSERAMRVLPPEANTNLTGYVWSPVANIEWARGNVAAEGDLVRRVMAIPDKEPVAEAAFFLVLATNFLLRGFRDELESLVEKFSLFRQRAGSFCRCAYLLMPQIANLGADRPVDFEAVAWFLTEAPEAQDLHRITRGLLANAAAEQGNQTMVTSMVEGMQILNSNTLTTCLIAGHRARLARATGDADEATSHWFEMLATARQQGFPLPATDAFEGLAVTAVNEERFDDAARLFGVGDALRNETGFVFRLPRERALVETAVNACRAKLGSTTFDEFGASARSGPWQDIADWALRARGERGRPTRGWDSLTPTESKVVACVAQGLTNPQIAETLYMSRATVKTHLAHVFAKLSVASRAELAAFATRHQGIS